MIDCAQFSKYNYNLYRNYDLDFLILSLKYSSRFMNYKTHLCLVSQIFELYTRLYLNKIDKVSNIMRT